MGRRNVVKCTVTWAPAGKNGLSGQTLERSENEHIWPKAIGVCSSDLGIVIWPFWLQYLQGDAKQKWNIYSCRLPKFILILFEKLASTFLQEIH